MPTDKEVTMTTIHDQTPEAERAVAGPAYGAGVGGGVPPIAFPPGTEFVVKAGDVAYVAAFPGSFVIHTEKEARDRAEMFRPFAPVAIYRIEIVDVLSKIEQEA